MRLVFLLIAISVLTAGKEFGPMTYDEIDSMWRGMSETYGNLMVLEDASEKFGLPKYSDILLCG